MTTFAQMYEDMYQVALEYVNDMTLEEIELTEMDTSKGIRTYLEDLGMDDSKALASYARKLRKVVRERFEEDEDEEEY